MYWKHGKLLKVKNHNGYHQLEKKKKTYQFGMQLLLPSLKDQLQSSKWFPASSILVVLKSSVNLAKSFRQLKEALAHFSELTEIQFLLTSTLAPIITCHTSSSSCEFIFPSKLVYCRYREINV